ncbi:MAG: tRNA (N6-isopentenyl adenosine(37)-C2)-methylthiotransferase MiaB [Gemmatimonadota bacterium]|nr:tRNA (N6-isopentenyl adenosine(37)-C2)-methylthiotransferase MiaB [Gemmatimonadota bacterium]
MNRTANPRAYVETYGCQMNIADGELMEGILGRAGYDIAESPEHADVILVNTCAIREHAERRVLGRVGQLNYFKRMRPEVVLGVTGCMAQRMQDALLEKAPYVDLIVGPDGYRGLATAVDEIRASRGPGKARRRLSMVELRIDEDYRGLEQRRESAVTAWVPIQRGCDHRCTFCIVPYVRGPEKNRDPIEVLEEVQDLAAGGVTEVTLLGQTVNSYAHGDWEFPRLLRSVSRISGIQRVRFTSPHPNDVTPELIEVMAAEDGVCEQIHLPVQSGSNRVLRRMLRRHTIEEYLLTVRRLRDRVPGIAISTDIIVAFPGETDEDFEETLRLVRRVQFDEAFTYRYSPRAGTPATRLPRHQFVPDEVAQERLERLIAETRTIQAVINERDVGRVEELLVEKMGRDEGMVMGRTRRNKVVVAPGDESDIGRYIYVRLTHSTGATFVAGRLPKAAPRRVQWPPLPELAEL